ncbi:MAG: hypothetical protein K6E50_05335 [Lachnospiraceae bacterium]|nr:hypothetical protein [Lachnospiraceae bacterium]
MKKEDIVCLILLAAELAAGFVLMGGDMMPVLAWWLMLLILGIGSYPLSKMLFGRLSDHGYLFGKLLGGLVPAWILWLFASLRLIRFSTAAVLIISLLVLVFWWGLAFKQGKLKELCAEIPLTGILVRELIFTAAFFLFCYIKCYNPDAFGTERMMDYGFMQSIFRADYFPPEDFWFAGEDLNYYYFGQYFCTFLTKLSFNSVSYGYNLALSMCFAFCMGFAFSLVYQWMLGHSESRGAAGITGTLAAIVLPGAASVHYLIFNFLVPWTWDILAIPGDKPSYWYADSTRYIGYHPETADRTAHEYPAYSFLLGDLHAHVINIFTVMTILALLTAWVREADEREEEENWVKQTLSDPKLWAFTFLTGICVMENFWDFPIYFVVGGAVLLALHLRSKKSPARVASVTAMQGIIVLLGAMLVSLPFQLRFQAMANGIRLAETHTPLYQLAILWALPLALLAAFFVVLFNGRDREVKGFRQLFRGAEKLDLCVLLIGLCGAGLILIPELIYVSDIYGGDFKRFNTMFKLSYQAFILLNLMMCYVVGRFVLRPGTAGQRKWGIIAGVILILCCGYFLTALRMSAGDIRDRERYKGLRADEYLRREAPMDADAVFWARENIPSGSLLLEANGDSYTISNRVSVITGLPTVLGWHTHEWLWHNDLDPVDARSADVETMYLYADSNLMHQYGVDYIFLGSCEYDKYGQMGMNDEELKALGDVVYTGPMQEDGRCACIIKLR